MPNGTDASHVDHLISGLSAAGAVESVGDFTLDRDKAREKMRQFQLAEPNRYVLELVQAAVLKGATRIDFHIDADDMRMRFDGRPFDRKDFEALYSSLFARMRNAENDARQHLAVGLNAAMALNPRYVRVDSGQGDAGIRLELRAGKDDRVTERIGEERTVIHVKARFRPGLVVGFFRDMKGTIPEEKLLRTHCARARTKIYLDGQSINQGYELSGAIAVQPIEAKGVHGLVGFNPAQTEGASIEWIKHGVWITTHDFHPSRDQAWVEALGLRTYPGLTAVVEADALRMDFSRQNVVWDDAYREVLVQLEAARNESVKHLCKRLGEGALVNQSQMSSWIIQLLKRVTASLTPAELGTQDTDALGYHVARATVWRTLTGDRVSLAQLWQELRENDTVGFTFLDLGDSRDPTLSAEALCEGHTVLRLNSDKEERLLLRIFGNRLQLVTKALQARLEAAQNRARFRRRQMKVALADSTVYLGIKTVMARELEGVMGLRRDRDQSCMSIVRDGCLLVQLTCDKSLPGLEMVFAGDFIPDETFTNIVPNAAYGQAVCAALGQLEALYTRVADTLSTLSEARRRHLLTFLVATRTPDFAERFLRAWGATAYVECPSVEISLGVGSEEQSDPGEAPHALAQVALISDVTGRCWSLVELSKQLDRLGYLPWVSSAMPENPDYPRLLLHLDVEEKALLDHVFGDSLRYDLQDYERSCRVVAHRKKPKVPLDVFRSTGPLNVKVGFECESLRGMLVFRWVGEAMTRAPSSLKLLLEERELVTYDVELGVPDLKAVITADDFQPNASWSGLWSRGEETRCQRLVHAAAVAVLTHLATHFDDVDRPFRTAVARLLRKGLSSLVPQAVFGEALRRLVARERTPWTRYMRLTALQAWVPQDQLATGLIALMHAGQPLTAEALWAEVASNDPLPEPLPRMQVDLTSCGELFGAAPRDRKTEVPLIRRLEELPLFRTITEDRVALAELRRRAAEEPLPYLAEQPEAGLLADRFVLLVDDGDRADLIRLLGAGALTDAGPLLESRRRAYEFESRGKSELRLLEGTTLISHPVRGEISGEVGLSDEPEEGNWLLVHKNQRYVCRQEGVFSQGIVAVLNSDALTTTQDFRSVESDGARAQMLAVCEDALPALLRDLAAAWPELTGRVRNRAYDHMLAYLAGPVATAERQAERPASELVRTLSGLQWLGGIGGQRYSVDELQAEHEAQGELVYLPTTAVGDTPRKIPVLSGRRLDQIQRMFPRVRDFSDEWEQSHLRETLGLMGAPEMAPHHPDDELVGARCRGAGFEGRLYLPASSEEPLVVRFGVAGLELGRQTLYTFAPCAGRLEIARTTYRQSGGMVQLRAHDRYNLQTACYRLYRELLRDFSRITSAALQQWGAALLRNVMLALHSRVDAQVATLEERWVRLYNDLTRQPLLSLPNGATMSLAAALQQQPEELQYLGLWQPQPLATPVVPVQNSTTPRQELTLPAESPPNPEQPPAAEPAAIPEAPPPMAGPPVQQELPEERLAWQLRRAFDRLGDETTAAPQASGHREVVRHIQRGLTFSSDDSQDAVDCGKRGLVLYRRHPLVGGVLARGEADPLLLSLLLSAIYTAVNLYLEGVTDDHENAFLDLLARGVLADLRGAPRDTDLRSDPLVVTT